MECSSCALFLQVKMRDTQSVGSKFFFPKRSGQETDLDLS
uniref:Uncharacterized protein n=1 Tax=Arundo donax TaxID=35708 RepID=A0A0A9AIP7_ARUDO